MTARQRLGRLQDSIALPLLLGIALFVVGAFLIDGFASIRSVRAILVLASFVGLASVGQTLVIIMGGLAVVLVMIHQYARRRKLA